MAKKIRVKKINGAKIITRWSVQSIFSGLICFALASIPIICLFVPIFTLSLTQEIEGGVDVNVVITGKEIIKWALNGFVTPELEPFYDLFDQSYQFYQYFEIARPFIPFVFFGLYVLSIFWALILAIKGIIYVFAGKPSPKGTRFSAYLSSINQLLTALVAIAFCAVLPALITDTSIKVSTTFFVPLIMYVCARLLTLAIKTIYQHSIKGRLYVGINDFRRLKQNSSSAQDPIIVVVVDNNDNDQTSSVSNSTPAEKKAIATKPTELKEIIHLIPQNIKEIKERAYSANQNLIEETIPEGVKLIGHGAFANCGALRSISLPSTLSDIETNAFFNCRSLVIIKYNGTKDQFKKVRKGVSWCLDAGTDTVKCTDGALKFQK